MSIYLRSSSVLLHFCFKIPNQFFRRAFAWSKWLSLVQLWEFFGLPAPLLNGLYQGMNTYWERRTTDDNLCILMWSVLIFSGKNSNVLMSRSIRLCSKTVRCSSDTQDFIRTEQKCPCLDEPVRSVVRIPVNSVRIRIRSANIDWSLTKRSCRRQRIKW